MYDAYYTSLFVQLLHKGYIYDALCFVTFCVHAHCLQVKLMTLFKGDAVVSDDECQQKLESLKIDMMKAFNYAQGL